MKYGKTELIRRISDIVRNGWNNNAIRDLVESLWRDPYSMRTSGFVREGGTDAVMGVQAYMTLVDEIPYYGITFTIGPKVKKFDFYQFREILTYHKKYWSESISFEAMEGLHAVYYDFDPQTYEQVLMHVHNPTYDQLTELLQWLVPVTFLYYDAQKHEIIYWGDNRHGSWWNPWMHDVLHKTVNSMRESGLEFSDVVADGDGSLESHAQFGITAGSCFHGDMRRVSSGVVAPADLPVFYFIVGDLPRIHETSTNSLVVDGLLCFNQGGGAVPATDGWFVMVHVFFTNCLYHPFIAVMGQAQYERVSTASYMVSSEVTLVRDRLPHQNLLHVGTLILQTSAAFTNSYHARIVTHAYGVKTDLSVSGDGSLVKPVVLVNDLDLPGPEKYYGTDKDEIKGFHDFPEVDPRLLTDGQAIYLHGQVSDVPGYSRALALAPQDDRTQYSAWADRGAGEVLIRSFVTDPGFPGVTLIPSGPWVFEHHMAVTTDDRCSLVVRVFRRDISGVESELFNFRQSIDDVVTARFLKAVAVDNVHLGEGDRLVFKYFHKSESYYSRNMLMDVEGITPDTRKWSCVRIPVAAAGEDNYVEGISFDEMTRTLTLQRTGTLPDLEAEIPSGLASVETGGSVLGDGSVENPVKLAGDDASPGGGMYYGTDESGVKGFHPLPQASSVSLILDKDFELCVEPSLVETFTLDMRAAYPYTILGVALETDAGVLESISVKIGGVAVTGLGDMDASTAAYFAATALNLVSLGSRVTLSTGGISSSGVTLLRVKMVYSP